MLVVGCEPAGRGLLGNAQSLRQSSLRCGTRLVGAALRPPRLKLAWWTRRVSLPRRCFGLAGIASLAREPFFVVVVFLEGCPFYEPVEEETPV